MIEKLISALVSKKKVIAWVSAVVVAAVAVATQLSSEEVKEAICGAPTINVDAPK